MLFAFVAENNGKYNWCLINSQKNKVIHIMLGKYQRLTHNEFLKICFSDFLPNFHHQNIYATNNKFCGYKFVYAYLRGNKIFVNSYSLADNPIELFDIIHRRLSYQLVAHGWFAVDTFFLLR